MRIIWIGLVSAGCCALFAPRIACGGLVLSFSQSAYVVGGLGGGVDVPVYVTQVPGGPQVASGNELLTAGVVVSYNNPAGVAAVLTSTDVSAGALWSSSSANALSATASLATTSLSGIADLSSPLLVGTFHFTGLSLGTTTISAANLTPGPSFETTQGNVLDPTNTAIAIVRVVPEPSGFMLLTAFAVSLGLAASRRGASSGIR
jgi:hypothetical protein